MIAQGVPERKIHVVYSGIDMKRFSIPSPQSIARLRDEFGIQPELPLIGNVAALTGHKDHRCLIESMALLKGRGVRYKLIILGEGEERTHIEEQIKKYNLEDSVILAGFRSDVGDFYSLFDIFVLSSRDEGLGTAILDALAIGIPVIATDAGGIPEILENEQYGLTVAKRNPELLAAAIEGLIKNSALRDMYKNKGPERARFFSAEDMVAKTYRLYETIHSRLKDDK